MEKVVVLRSLYRSICRRSLSFAVPDAATINHHDHQHLRRGLHYFHPSPASRLASPRRISSNGASSFATGIGSIHSFSEDVSHLPVIVDKDIENAFKDLMAASWDELPAPVIYNAKKALSKDTDDQFGKEALANVFRAAEACEEFSGILVTLKMELDDVVGLSGENVKPLSDKVANALRVAYQRYTAYLDSFGPDEVYLRKKVENELGSKMIHLKMRCSGLGSEWGKVTVLGTSGLSGSYIEHRA